ncbi:MAG: SufE family protein [Myxococcota bacterium]
MTVDELVERFELFDEWEERYRYLIDLGRKLPPMPEEAKTEETKVEGCISQVWMVAETVDGDRLRLRFVADSDAHIVKGLVAVLLMLVNDRTPQEILDLDMESLFGRLGLDQHISANRRNGFVSMIGRMKAAAREAAAAPA